MWAATSTFVVDGLYLGVRSTTTAADEVLRAALAEHLVADVVAPPNYSVQLGEPADGGASGFHFLHRSSSSIVRTRDARRVFRALVAHLSSHGDDTEPGLMRVHGVTLVAGDRAVLAPGVLRQWPELIERRLNARGLRFADTPWALVDPTRAEVVVPEPSLAVDWSALDTLDELAGARDRVDPPVEPGRYPLVGWAFWLGAARAGPLSRAQAVVQALRLRLGSIDTAEGLEGLQRTLDEVAMVMREVEPTAIAADDPVDLVGPLVALASGGRSEIGRS